MVRQPNDIAVLRASGRARGPSSRGFCRSTARAGTAASGDRQFAWGEVVRTATAYGRMAAMANMGATHRHLGAEQLDSRESGSDGAPLCVRASNTKGLDDPSVIASTVFRGSDAGEA